MTLDKPLRVDISARNWCCVLDAELALSRFGLLYALRLAEEMNVWVVRTLWSILDNSRFYQTNPELLGAGRILDPNAPSSRAKMSDLWSRGLGQWESARLETALMGRLFWLGDSNDESMIPKEMDEGLNTRFGLLAEQLESRLERHGVRLANPVVALECFRDALALAAALTRYNPVILTTCAATDDISSDNEPRLCGFIRKAGIPCKKAKFDDNTRMMKMHLAHVFTRTGALELMCAGLKIAAIHLVAPQALLTPVRKSEHEFHRNGHTDKASDHLDASTLWDDAVAFWYAFES